MSEDVTKMWEKFNLLEVESVGIKTQEEDFESLVVRGNACVMGKLLADRTVGKEIIRTPLLRAWQPSGWVSFKSVGANTFLIEFENEWDKIRIMEGRPWTFDGDLVSLADFDGLTPPSEIVFEKAAFWVRMYNLPLACMSKEMGTRIGSTVGEVEEVEIDENGAGWGEFLRVRIVLDLTKPLSRGRMLHVRDKTIWIAFKYEKIPRFCFKCGIIRHGRRGCIAPGGRRTLGNGDAAQFGIWLRVNPGGNRNGGARRGRPNSTWRNTANSPAYSANSDRREEDEGNNGSPMEANGGASTGTAETRSQTNSGIKANFGKSQPLFNTSGIPGNPLSQEREVTAREIYEEELEGQISRIDEIVGDSRSGINGKNDAPLASSQSQQVNGKGKNIYMGQWDTIKKKMVWETLEKESDVAKLKARTGHIEFMEGSYATPTRKYQVQDKFNLGRADSEVMLQNGLSSSGPTHWKRAKRAASGFHIEAASGTKMGKRKNSDMHAARMRMDEKRYRLVDENEEACSDNEAVAAEQPRHTQ